MAGKQRRGEATGQPGASQGEVRSSTKLSPREALTQEIRSLVLGMGADLVGIASVDRFEGAPRGHHPTDWLPGCQSVIVFAIRQLEAAHDWPWMMQGTAIATPENRLRILQEYWFGVHNHDVHDGLLDQMALNLALHLQRLGYSSLFQEAGVAPALRLLLHSLLLEPPVGLFSHRHAAVRAGLGEFGLNNLVITPEYGPYVRFVSVLTEADLLPDSLIQKKACLGRKCSLCLDLCGGEVLTQRPEARENNGVWLNPPTRTNRPLCAERRKVHFCRGQCVARCPVGLPLRATRKRLPGAEEKGDGRADLPVFRQIQWPARAPRRHGNKDLG